MNLVFATAESSAAAEPLGVPEGRHDHSPAFQRRVHHGQLSLRDDRHASGRLAESTIPKAS